MRREAKTDTQEPVDCGAMYRVFVDWLANGLLLVERGVCGAILCSIEVILLMIGEFRGGHTCSRPSGATRCAWCGEDTSRPSVCCVSPRPNQDRYMIMAFSFLDIEFDLHFGPEALNTLPFVPRTNLKLDAPRDPFSSAVPLHNGRQAPSTTVSPLFHTSIFVGDCAKPRGGLSRRGRGR